MQSHRANWKELSFSNKCTPRRPPPPPAPHLAQAWDPGRVPRRPQPALWQESRSLSLDKAAATTYSPMQKSPGIEEGGARMPATPLCRPGTAGQKGQQVPEGPDRWASGAGSARTKVRLGQGPGASAHVLTASSRTLNRDDARMCAATAGRQSAYLGSRFTQIFLSPFSMLGSAEQRVRRLADGSPDTGGHVVRWRRRGGGLGLPVTMSAMATPLFPVCSLVSQTVTFDHMVFKSSVL